ncbi:Prp19-domain-containing protein [Eremomyces bilateralis CBS 781.70]|uniref:Pre-mRNA-processing factor 19 n=1 Tax=Eremomyces bilateralis CBS 781.70 TaxID=1392243 RepID=A0A6G1GCB5_9PEZI|nr:Prp19-domain-containing protein [Eremomyces bilateralis CBS 781.70]KAF1815735.1 Prp19-domain-containing protein [Eremomyces bilateralis CBS 781.70]
MLCAISGEAPQEPVASSKSGNVFERRLIETYITENGTDPITNEPLTLDDLLPLRTARVVRPRPPTLTSIPALLSTFQNEWDAIALECYTLKSQLQQTRQELSTALYQHEAAMRVIARVTRERDEAREALSRIGVSAGAGAEADQMAVDAKGLSGELAEKVETTQAELQSTRRLAVDETGQLVLAAGGKGAGVFSVAEDSVVQTLDVGGVGVTDGLWVESRPVVGLTNGSVVVFNGEGEATATFKSHAGPAMAVTAHPSGEILISVGVDKSYVVYDLPGNKVVLQNYTESELSCAQFHPDGHLFAAGGKDGEVKVYQINTGEKVGGFQTDAPVRSLSFSENGTWLASVSEGQSDVTIWDLRKMTAIKTLEIGSAVSSVRFDYTGQFLAVTGPGNTVVMQYKKKEKQWLEPLRKGVSGEAVAWGESGKSLMVVTGDGGLVQLTAA